MWQIFYSRLSLKNWFAYSSGHMLDNIHHGQVWEVFLFHELCVLLSFPEESTWQILFQSSYKCYQLYFHCWSFRLHITSLVSVLLPLSYPEREFFRAKIDKDFHSIVLPPFFQLGCIFVERFESAVLDHHLKFSLRFRKGSLPLRTCSAAVSCTSVSEASSSWPQPLCQCTQLFQE